MKQRHGQSGFTLVELAMVMALIGMIFGGALLGYRSFIQQAHYTQTQHYLENTRTALLNYALVHGHLPCPDTDVNDPDGIENRPTSGPGVCDDSEGLLPWQQLGLERRTPYGEIAFYMVNRDVSDDCPAAGDEAQCYFELESAPAFNLATPPRDGRDGSGNLMVEDADNNPVAERVVAIVGSRGRNFAAVCNTLTADERENCDDDDTFVQERLRQNDADFFDDQLIWLHANTLKGQMRDAGLL